MKNKLSHTGTIGYGYGRFSSKPQEKGDSHRLQTEWIKSEAKKLTISLKEIYFDQGVSGKEGKNLDLELGKLLNIIKRGQVILIHEIDRLGRQNPILLNKIIYDIVSKGVEIRTSDGSIINEESIEEVNTSVPTFLKSALAHIENKKKGKRVHEAHIDRLEAIFTNNTPSWFVGPCWISYDHKKECYVYDEDKINVIKRIIEMVEDGKGLLKILQKLNQDGVPPISTRKNTKHWSRTMVDTLLHKKALYGCFESKDGRTKEGHYKPIISKERFYKIQDSLKKRKKHGSGRPSPFDNIYKGLLVCGCGSKFMYQAKHSHGRVNRYLVCHAQIEGRCLYPYTSLRHDTFDNSFRFQVLSDPKTILSMFKEKKTSNKSNALQGELDTVEGRLKKYQSDLENGTVELTNTLDRVIINLESKVKSLKQELEMEKVKESQSSELPTLLRGFFKTQGNMFLIDPRNSKIEWSNEKLKTFIERIEMDLKSKQFTVVYKDQKQSAVTYPLLIGEKYTL